MSRVIRLFANLGATETGPVLKNQSRKATTPVFLRQSPMDRACGPMSLLMALIALGVFQRDALVYGEGPQAKLARLMRRRAQAFHFTGALAVELTWLLRPAERWV